MHNQHLSVLRGATLLAFVCLLLAAADPGVAADVNKPAKLEVTDRVLVTGVDATDLICKQHTTFA